MTQKLLREYFELCPEGNCALNLLSEAEKRRKDNGSVFLVGVIQRAGRKNGNGRIYPKPILEREIERYQILIKERRSLGELDHPDDSVINLKNASHLVTQTWFEGDDVYGKIEVVGTPSGEILKQLVRANVRLGISSRGLGSVKTVNGDTIVEDDFQLICFDMVSEPSTPGAFLSVKTPGLRITQENSLNENYSKDEKINSLIKEILK